MGNIKLWIFLRSAKKLKILFHFEILTWESIGKSEMWNISKTADRGMKRAKIWDLGVPHCTYVGYF